MTGTICLPQIIQGGMGIAVSDWRLANAVSREGGLGVVSGTGVDIVMARRLQVRRGWEAIRRALDHFPYPEMAQRVLDRHLSEKAKTPREPFSLTRMLSFPPSTSAMELMVVANFVEVFLAKEGHEGKVGINYLEKIQLASMPSIFGAMLAKVDCVLMGAGIPWAIPSVLDGLSKWQKVELQVSVETSEGRESKPLEFDPKALCPTGGPELPRPSFLAVISSSVVAKKLLQKAQGSVEGFVVENHTAGGHNAPPRGASATPEGQTPSYGPKDNPDLNSIAALKRPFWLAGGYASPELLKESLAQGAAGIQVGTAFAYCEESGILPEIKEAVKQQCLNGTLEVATDHLASPTGFPFKIASMPEEGKVRTESRARICDLGYLRRLFLKPDGTVGFRCPSEPEKTYVHKGGTLEETEGRQCLCNGLLATAGLGQPRPGGDEPPMLTMGLDFSAIARVIRASRLNYSAKDVLNYLRG